MKLFKGILFSFMVILTFGCAPALNMSIGSLLRLDESGHVRRDYEFSIADSVDQREVIYLFKDGTYLYSEEEAETFFDKDGDGDTEEEWAMVAGQRGTYTYNAETLLLRVEYSQFMEVSSGSNDWVSYDTNSGDDRIWITTVAITENAFQPAYTFASDGFFEMTDISEKFYGKISTNKTRYKINASTLDYEYSQFVSNTNGVFSYAIREREHEILSKTPSDAAFEEGTALSLMVADVSDVKYSYTNDYVNQYTNIYGIGDLGSYSFQNCGDFVISEIQYFFY